MSQPRLILVPPHITDAATDMHAHCRTLRFALKAYAGLEKLLAEGRHDGSASPPIERGEIAALLALINEEVERRLADAAEAAEVLREIAQRAAQETAH